MITRDQFALQIDRLIDTFGEKAFSAQREHLIWESVDGLEYANVIAIVDEFIRNSRHAPLPGEFSKAASDYRKHNKRYALGEVKPMELANCKDCLDSGFVLVTRKSEFQRWAKWQSGSAACHCERGRELIQAGLRRKSPIDLGSQFSDHWSTSYDIVGYPRVPSIKAGA